MSGERDALVADREFLLRSLDDLEVERAAGNIDDATYHTLHDDYTARAAAVLRALERGEDYRPTLLPPVPWPMRLAVGAGVLLFAVTAAVGLARAVGSRAPGQTATGNDQVARPAAVLDDLAAAVAENPDSYATRIAYARALSGNEPVAALREYDTAARLDPSQPEPLTYGGWITALAARDVTEPAQREVLLDGAFERLDAAIALDPEYPDAYVFRGLVHFNLLGDAATAVPDLQRFLALAPEEHPMREIVHGALARAIEQVDAGAGTVPARTP
jgi:tetratricopeptide (TPR) repeat protein